MDLSVPKTKEELKCGNKAWLPSNVEEVLVKCWCRGRKKEEREAKNSERIETARVACRG